MNSENLEPEELSSENLSVQGENIEETMPENDQNSGNSNLSNGHSSQSNGNGSQNGTTVIKRGRGRPKLLRPKRVPKPPTPTASTSNDRKRRSPSDNSDDDPSEGMINVGKDYQAVLPDLIADDEIPFRRQLELHPAQRLYSAAACRIPEKILLSYISFAKKKHGYNEEQAVGMLYYHRFSLERTQRDLDMFCPMPDIWTENDKRKFKETHSLIIKETKRNDFNRIKKALPTKSLGSIMFYYYTKFYKRVPNTLTAPKKPPSPNP